MEFLAVGLFLLLVPFLLPIGLWVALYRTRARLGRLETAIAEQRRAVELLSQQIAALRSEGPGGAGPESIRATAERVAARGSDPAAPCVDPGPPVAAAPDPPVAPAAAASRAAARGAPAETPPAAARRQLPDPGTRESGPGHPPRPSAPPGRKRRLADLPRAFDWENLIGVKLFSAIAGVALVVAAILFLRYSMQQGWLQPPVRVLIGVLVAVSLLVVCEMKAARRYPVTADALDAAAVAILFATFFAAHVLWALLPAAVTFLLLAAVTALAVLLSIRRESLFIAVLGLLGGFATPVLLASGENRPVPLFAYVGLLNVGLAWVAYRQVWPILTILTLALTTAYQWGWAIRFLAASELPLGVGIFALFPVLSVAGLLLARRGRTGMRAREDEVFERTALFASALPLLFAAYLAAVPAYGARPALLFVFLLFIDAGLLAVSVALGRGVLHALGAAATLVVWAVWLATSYAPGARALARGFAAVFVLLYLFGPSIAARFGRELQGRGAMALYAAPAMLFVFAVIPRIDAGGGSTAPFALLFGLVLLCAWRAAVLRRGPIFFAASFMAVAAEATWAATHLTPARLPAAVLVFASFGLIGAGAPVAARRAGRPLLPAAGAGAVLLASLALLLPLGLGPVSPAALWGLALLLAILNAAIFVESASSRIPRMSQAGSLLSCVVLSAWWLTSAGAVGVLPSLAVVTGLTLLMLGGHVWARHVSHADGRPGGTFADGAYLGLLGHLFLLLFALNREWSLPPWPLFGALAVATLGAGAASAVAGLPHLHAGATGAAALVVAAWTAAAGVMPWTLAGVLAAAVVVLYALAWVLRAGGRLGAGSRNAAAAALFGGQLTLILASASAVPPPFPVLAAAHAATLALLLALTVRTGWTRVAPAAAVSSWVALLERQAGHDLSRGWAELLILAGIVYVSFVAYALHAGPRSPQRREPWVVALGVSAVVFLSARAAFDAGGLDWMVGVVPLVQGLVTALLLRSLLRLEPPGARDLTRLALVAGAALAFVTVAIPLQLEHQWLTIAWALEAAALAWLYRRVPHRGLLLACAALFAAVFARLAVNPSVWTYEPRGTLRVFNWYLYTYLLSSGAMLLAARYLRAGADRLGTGLPRLSALLPAAAAVLLFLLLNIEIADYYATGPEVTFRFGATVSQDLTYTIGWLAFGMLLLAAGIYQRSRAARIAAVALIAVTTFKCFFYDLGSLEGLYRIASFVGLAVALAIVALVLQKFVLARPGGAA